MRTVVQSFDNKHHFLSQLSAGVGSKRRLLEEKPEDKYEMDAPIDREQRSEETVIPSVNSEEKMPSLAADFQHDGEKPFSDNIFQIQNYIPDNGTYKIS